MSSLANPTQSADALATEMLIPADARADFHVTVQALLARNKALEIAETVRGQEQVTKREVAERAAMDPSVVRRMLTAESANPTAENLFRVLGALGVRVEAITPDGVRTNLI
jgi:DNA-binding phage protein